jgi:putative peptide zinc metalloprotease protein
MPEPAKIEFLTRSPDEAGFQIHHVQSSQARGLFRPQRLPEVAWEVTAQPQSFDGSRHFVLRNLQRDRYVLLSSQEHFLWNHFDGNHTLIEIAKILHFEFGAFDYSIINQLLRKLYSAGLLAEVGASDVQASVASKSSRRWARALVRLRRAWGRISFKIRDADRYSSAIYRRGGFLLFNPLALALCLGITAYAVVALLRLWPQAREITLALAGMPVLSTAVMIATMLFVAVHHVLVHALACKAYGRKVREIGFFLLQGVLPTFYADVTDIFMSSRRARIVVDLAGPLVEVACGSFAFIAAYWSPPGVGQSLFFAAGILLWEGALLNLYPFNFLELDGYNILADLLAMPTLRQRAMTLLPKLPRRLLRGPNLQKSEWYQTSYLAICFASVILYIVLHLDALGLGWLIGSQ